MSGGSAPSSVDRGRSGQRHARVVICGDRARGIVLSALGTAVAIMALQPVLDLLRLLVR